MSEQLCLRWEERRSSLRRPSTAINPKEYDVAPLPRNDAKAFVAQHHYQGTFSADRKRFGLYRHGVLVGAAVFAHPTNGDTPVLSRFVLLNEVPGNGETWFLARCFAELARPCCDVCGRPLSVDGHCRNTECPRFDATGDEGQGFSVIDSFSDPVPRTTLDGRTIMPGHVGTIYQAFNGRCVGRSCARTLWLLPDGRALNDRSIQKIRGLVHEREHTWKSAAAPLIAAGASPLLDDEDGAEWLRRWRPKLCRSMRHPGNWKYVWALTRAARRGVEKLPRLPYPKKDRST